MSALFGRRDAMRLAASTALVAGSLPFAAKAADLSGVTLRVATYKGQDAILLPAAHQQDTPYRVAYAEFAGGNLIVEAMNAGAIDLGSWSEIPLVFAAASGANVKAIAVEKGDVNRQAVIVPKDSPIRTLADLRGKRVGYVRATTAHYFLLKMLQQAGLSFADITAINLSPTDGRAAFQSGALDAWAIYGYAIDFAIAQDGARVLKNAVGILSGNYLVGARPGALQDALLRAAISDYLGRLRRSYDWSESHKSAWAPILARAVNVPVSFISQGLATESQRYQLAAIDPSAIASCQDVADVFAKAKLLPRAVDVAPYFDRSFGAVLEQS
jgi:sulfonate transport system substrate-binding protein